MVVCQLPDSHLNRHARGENAPTAVRVYTHAILSRTHHGISDGMSFSAAESQKIRQHTSLAPTSPSHPYGFEPRPGTDGPCTTSPQAVYRMREKHTTCCGRVQNQRKRTTCCVRSVAHPTSVIHGIPDRQEKAKLWEVQVCQGRRRDFVVFVRRREPEGNLSRQTVIQVLERAPQSVEQVRLGICLFRERFVFLCYYCCSRCCFLFPFTSLSSRFLFR